MKKILILGGSENIKPVAEEIHKLGYYAVTCSNSMDEPGHKYSDECYKISVLDKEGVLELAKKINIDGILSFSCDAGVVTAAYVAEKLGLPFQCSYESACILQNKGNFRKFLSDNGFNCPKAKSYTTPNIPEEDYDYFNWPVIVKPVDSAGSKGVSRVDNKEDLEEAIKKAISFSYNGDYIVEEFLTIKGYRSDSDFFTINGKIVFSIFSDQMFDVNSGNPYNPTLYIWPTTMEKKHQDYLESELQRLMNLLGMKTGIYNIETCIGSDDTPYIMEVSPRGGGNRIAELQRMATGVDLIKAEVEKCVGNISGEIVNRQVYGAWCEYTIHACSNQSGRMKNVRLDSDIENKYVKFYNIQKNKGDIIESFTGAGKAIGNIILRFKTREELDKVMNNVSEWLHIELYEEE